MIMYVSSPEKLAQVIGASAADNDRAEIQQNHLETIQDLLFRVLSPVGAYREQVRRSKGRRWKKFQHRKATKSEGGEKTTNAHLSVEPEHRPEVLPYLTVGFNSTARCLESLCEESMPDTVRQFLGQDTDTKSKLKRKWKTNRAKKELVAVFVCRSTLSPAHYAHIPQLVKLASKSRTLGQEIRLVPLSKGAEARLAKVMNLPRVGIIGLMDCKLASVLIDYVRDNVPG